jgi:sugar transferase (PEP-CTERM/EpsH1 system associated)
MAHILILTPQLPIPPHALTGAVQGTTIRNFHLIANLAQRHTIDLACFAADEPDALALLQPYCRQIVAVPPPVRTIGRRARDTLLSALPDMALRLASAEMRRRLQDLIAAHGKDYAVVQVEGIEMAPYMTPAPADPFPSRRDTSPRLVFDNHNAEYVLQRRAFSTDLRHPRRWLAAAYSLAQWRKLVAYERRICQSADRVVAVSEADRTALQRLAPGLNVTVVPNGVDLTFNRPGVVPPQPGLGPHSLVFTGKMDYRPNVDAVLWFAEAVLPLILAEAPDAHLYLVGQQPHVRLDPLRGHSAITLTGRVPDTRPYIAAAGAYIVPLRIGGGTRLKVLEAMAMGQAIVSTRLGCDGFPFMDGCEALLADAPADFARAVLSLFRDPARAAALGRAARACVEAHFGWEAIVPRLEALYP